MAHARGDRLARSSEDLRNLSTHHLFIDTLFTPPLFLEAELLSLHSFSFEHRDFANINESTRQSAPPRAPPTLHPLVHRLCDPRHC